MSQVQDSCYRFDFGDSSVDAGDAETREIKDLILKVGIVDITPLWSIPAAYR